MSVPSRLLPSMVNEFGPVVVLIHTFPKSAKGDVKTIEGVLAAARLTVIEYVFVLPFAAVTTIVIVLAPTFNAIGGEATALGTELPLTVIVAVASAAVGVTEIVFVAFDTLSV